MQQGLRLFEEMYAAAHTEDAKRRLAYWIGRLEFSIHAILEIIEVNAGQQSLAKAKKVPGSEEAGKLLDEARACYERGISEGRAAVNAVTPVTVETTDRAAVGAYYHFLVRQVEEKVNEIFADR